MKWELARNSLHTSRLTQVTNLGDELLRNATIKVLVVADSSVGLNPNFGVGKAIEAIRAHAPSYAKILVDLARRDQQGNHLDTFAVNPTANQTTLIAKYRGLRFDHAESGDRTSDPALQIISQYDQIWVFGFAPVGARTPAVDDDEVRALTRWMDERRGGVFATGIAGTLGAALAARIPRVSTMRRWTRGPAEARAASFTLTSLPHPVLCGGSDFGLIDVLPDHSHEGWVHEDAEVDLSRTTLTGNAEYPSLGAVRETPHAISWAKGLPDPTASASELAEAERWMALLGVYNGHASGVGRVVVDSTWHHWMDINLLALEAAAATATVDLPTLSDKRARNAALEVIANYDKIVRYFINIAIWLAPPTKQHWMLHAATGWAVTQPRSKQDLDERTPTEMAGQLAAETLARQVGPCQLDEWLHLLSPGPKPRPHWPPAPLTWPRRFELLGSLVKELLALSPEAQSHGLRPLSSACSPHRESSAAGSDATDPARA